MKDSSELDSLHTTTHNNNKRSKRPRFAPSKTTAFLQLNHLGVPLTSPSTDSPVDSIRFEPDRPYTVGRSPRRCDLVVADRRVGAQHCQVFYDSVHRKLYIIDGTIVSVNQFRNQLDDGREKCGVVRASLNGVFVNGARVRRGGAAELRDGDRVSFACSSVSHCIHPVGIGFLVDKIVIEEREIVVDESDDDSIGTLVMSGSQGSKRVYASRGDGDSSSSLIARANGLLSECRRILRSDDPVDYIRKRCRYSFCSGFIENNVIRHPRLGVDRSLVKGKDCNVRKEVQETSVMHRSERILVASKPNSDALRLQDNGVQVPSETPENTDKPPRCEDAVENKKWSSNVFPQPGKRFYLNRLACMDKSYSNHHPVISLPELLYPVQSISQMFIATFTSDILWFMSSCEIPSNMPITVACHNTERCWSSDPDKRSSQPYPEYPNLIVVCPPFPEATAFGNDRTRHGIGCHHPKFFVLQRDDSIRVIITSANLVPTQWNIVTNTIWWQDFPRSSSPDYSSIFTQFHDGEVNPESNSDFASYLAGFIVSLLTDVPRQAQWIIELAKYDFGGAVGHLIASVPGIHSYKAPYIVESRHSLCADHCASGSFDMKMLGSVETSVVGLSYLFHKVTDANGAKLKKLASFLRRSCNANVLSIVLTRNTNIPADANAVSIHVQNSSDFSDGECVQLGFLPRDIAKWVSPLWDIGFFRFSGYVCPKEALAAALGGNNRKVRLILHVSQGPEFQNISKLMQDQHVIALCSLVAAIQRCTGLWRLQEVLGRYKWPESFGSDFVYGASSIGSINARFLAEFSAAAGKKSMEFESEESDPEWGCWNASHESKSPSIKIIFPTIERVKNSHMGIFPSRRILCFSEKTWQRLWTTDILCDAIPHPYDRVGHPMHTKVARRRFQSRTAASSCGWVYCGSHNFSAAAWGRSISNPFGLKPNGLGNIDSSLGQMLHICNYELGIIFTFPQKETDGSSKESSINLDDIVLPFVVPAPKYKQGDRPATGLAMRQALAELSEQEREKHVVEDTEVEVMEENPDEDDVVEATDYVPQEKEEDKAYAETLWSQVDSSQSC